MKKTGAVLVAAGKSSRMKEFKPMLPFGSSTIAIHIVSMLKEMNLDPIVVVTGYRAEQLETHLSHMGVRFVRNERYEETEMFDSVKIGLKSIADSCERVLLMPIDTPAIMPDTIRQVLKIEAGLIRTVCKGEPGHPLIIDGSVISTICSYKGNRGLRGAMEESGIPITNLEVEDEGIYRDVDTREEYERLLEWNFQRGEGYPVRVVSLTRLVASDAFFGPGPCQLLEMIDQTGSLQEACNHMELSYTKGSRMIRTVERQLGFPVVERWTGGAGGGGSRLTEQGKELVKNYRKLAAGVQEAAEELFYKYFGKGF